MYSEASKLEVLIANFFFLTQRAKNIISKDILEWTQ